MFTKFHPLRLMMFTAVLAAPGFAADWPEFRGPTGQGISSERSVPVEWSQDKNVTWKVAVPGLGWSSPVVGGGRVYLTTAVAQEGADGLSLRALCLDAKTGQTHWDVEVFGPATTRTGSLHGKNSYASPTPVLEDQRLYVHFGHNGTACLDLRGKVIWRNESLRYPPVHGSGGSPIVVDDKLVFSSDGERDPFVVALRKTTGEVLWKFTRQSDAKKKFSFGTPLVITVQGRQQIITPGSGVVNALDPRDGREIWRVRYGEGYSVVPRPVFGHGLIFLGTGFDRASALAIRPDGQGDVTDTHVAWTLTKGAPLTPSMLLAGDELYMISDSGIASCVDAKTGQVHWQERVGGNHSASPLYAGGHIFFQSEEGVGTALKAGREFVKVATNPLHERSLASAATADNALFLRTAEHLYKISAAASAR